MWRQLLCVCVCYCWWLQCVSGQSPSCHPGEPTASCAPSNSCVEDHPSAEEELQCMDQYLHPSTPIAVSASGLNITSCRRAPSFFYLCDAQAEHPVGESQYFKIKRVNLMSASLDPWHFAVNVSWLHNQTDVRRALTVPPPDRALRGYEVRLRHDGDVIACWCVWETNVSSLLLGLDNSLEYRSSATTMESSVRSLPYRGSGSEERYVTNTESPVAWPNTCRATTTHTADSCGRPLYNAPQDLRVASLSDQIQVTWSPPAAAVSTSPPLTTPPLLYYINVSNTNQDFSFVANGTRNVTISGLNLTLPYAVQVQAYSPCTGLSAYASSSDEDIGCGLLSDATYDSGTDITTTIDSPDTSPLPTTTTTSSATTSPTDSAIPRQASELLLPLLLTGLVLLILVPVAILAVFIGYSCHRHQQDRSSRYDPVFPPDCANPNMRVLVLYSPSTPQREKEEIEYHVVGRLKQHFTVVSCNDHIQRTIMDWAEEQTRHAHSVLILCNKNFHAEWGSHQGSQLVNSLKTIVSYSVACGNLDKFATVLLDKDHDRYIPKNQYLEAMRSFVLGESAGEKDVDGLTNFVKVNYRNRKKLAAA